MADRIQSRARLARLDERGRIHIGRATGNEPGQPFWVTVAPEEVTVPAGTIIIVPARDVPPPPSFQVVQ
ncbi:hypothetical protein [Agromyces sp. NPDC058104]|uniref:hypothetical protein n=1 Tax=Agromyces sp. NPDC058104 TaxID=3346342 RepID=UPI0036D77659